MDTNSALRFLLDIFNSLQDVAGELLQFLTETPFEGQPWTWGNVIFGTAVFAFLGYAVVRWIIP